MTEILTENQSELSRLKNGCFAKGNQFGKNSHPPGGYDLTKEERQKRIEARKKFWLKSPNLVQRYLTLVTKPKLSWTEARQLVSLTDCLKRIIPEEKKHEHSGEIAVRYLDLFFNRMREDAPASRISAYN